MMEACKRQYQLVGLIRDLELEMLYLIQTTAAPNYLQNSPTFCLTFPYDVVKSFPLLPLNVPHNPVINIKIYYIISVLG